MKRSSGANRAPLFFSEAGSVFTRSLVIAVTAIVVASGISGVLFRYGQKQQVDNRKAQAISEYGLMVALQRLQSEPSLVEDIVRTPFENGWYEVRFQRSQSGDTVFMTVRADGHCGSESQQSDCVLRLDASGDDSIWVRSVRQ